MTRHIIFGIIFVSMGFWLCGCAMDNGYIKFYVKDKENMTPAEVRKLRKSRNFPNKIRLIRTDSMEETLKENQGLIKYSGCFYIGGSAFRGPVDREHSAKKATEHFGANTVVNMILPDFNRYRQEAHFLLCP